MARLRGSTHHLRATQPHKHKRKKRKQCARLRRGPAALASSILPPIAPPAPTRPQRTSTKNNKTVPVAQINLKFSPKRLAALRSAVELMDHPWEIIAIQDPPVEIAWQAGNIAGYAVWFTTERPLTDADNPYETRRRTSNGEPPTRQLPSTKVQQSCFLCPFFHTGLFMESGAFASLHIERPGRFEDLVIHNVYNLDTQINLDIVEEHCTGRSHLLVGDFNLHARLWGGPGALEDPKGEQLATMTQRKGMRCLNHEGVWTWSRSAADETARSVIDLAFAGIHLDERFLDWSVVDVDGFDSDHRIVVSRFGLGVKRRFLPYSSVCWVGVKAEEYTDTVEKALDPLHKLPVDTEDDIDEFARSFVEMMRPTLPTKRRLNIRKRYLQRVEALVQLTYERHMAALETQKHAEGQDLSDARAAVADKIDIALNGSRAVYQLDKLAARWSAPRGLPIPYFADPHTTPATQTSEHRAEIYMAATFFEFACGSEKPPTLVELPSPPRPPAVATSHVAPRVDATTMSGSEPGPAQPLTAPPDASSDGGVDEGVSTFELLADECPPLAPGELFAVVSNLKKKKSPHPDGVGNEAYRLSKGASVPHMGRLFNACLKLSYFPKPFRAAETVLLKKPGKSNYGRAQSWRPIALLSCLGKILERVVADRLSTLASYLNLVDKRQFAATGRSTTQALEYFLSVVYRGWCPGLHACC
ncbi:hypothetical protein QBC40DRAFT_264395 [Triangularia verruculosa]|uniref:Endonuclease/exonuclease/phosphatase domain-containing protein n=1 Tax=Triangularia verruculosa TaxID=2587418 RepID=A0AAN7AXR7_9PEZI|nr:hypothetical protein QBC40DRAFT_264395 [Triangularia verruculosa]